MHITVGISPKCRINSGKTNTIPICLNIFIIAIGILVVLIKYCFFGKNNGMILDHIIGFFAISLFLLLIYFITKGRGIGGGDIKLMAAAGLMLGWKYIIVAFFIGCVLAAVVHPIRMLISHKGNILAFGPYLSVGITIALLFGNQIVSWYIQFLNI